jgi:alpha-ketoglutarate-dependent taurine dioxygenase
MLTRIHFDPVEPKFVERLKRTLISENGVLITGLPCEVSNGPLLHIATALGIVSNHGLGRKSSQLEGGGVQRVEPMVNALEDKDGFPMLSTTHAAFPLHTDDSFNRVPVDCVLFHCWESADSGGDTLWTLLSDVIASLNSGALQRLQTIEFPWDFGDAPIITRGARGFEIRYSEYELNKTWQLRDSSPSNEQQDAMAELHQTFQSTKHELRMKEGDCIIFDNHKVLHGRTAITAGGRLLKRVRIHRYSDGTCL